jgi:hypothetical protein
MFPFLKKDTPIHLVIDQTKLMDRMSWDDAETMEMWQAGDRNMGRMKTMAAHWMVDEKNEYMSEKDAIKVLGRLSLEETEETLIKFFNAFSSNTINPTNGNASNLPSEAGQAATFPAGSAS